MSVRRAGNLNLEVMLAAAAACVLMLATVLAWEPVYAENEEIPDNGLPVVYLTIDESRGTIEAMNKSSDHSIYCYGTIRIDVPEGFHYSDMKDTACESLPEMDMEIRGRGNTTWGYAKKPYKIKLLGDEGADVLGLGSNKHWVLIANALDKTLMKDRISAWLGDEIGMEFTPRGEPVDLVMKNKEGTFYKYLGSYYLSENVRVDTNRVEIDELKKKITDPDSIEITGGYLIQNSAQEDPISPNVWKTDSGQGWANHTPNFDPADGGYENEAQKKYIRDFIQDFEDTLYNGDFEGKNGKSYRDMMDLDSAAKYWLVDALCANGDGYGTGSTYIYKKRDQMGEDGERQLGKLYWGPLWDFDFAWNYEDNIEEMETQHDWVTAMFADKGEDGFVDAVYRNWYPFQKAVRQLYKDGGIIDQYYEEVKASQAKDYVINPFGEQDPDITGGGSGQDPGYADDAYADDENTEPEEYVYEEECAKLKKWIKNRLAWMTKHMYDLENLAYTVSYYVDGELVHKQMYRNDFLLQDFRDIPGKEGYTFVGWVDEKGKTVEEDTHVLSDMNLYAKFLPDSEVSHADRLYFQLERECVSLKDVGIDGEYDIKYTVLPANAVDKEVIWTSSDESVATVDRKGFLRFKKAGRVTIKGTLRYNSNVSREILIIAKDTVDPATSLSVDKQVINMKKGAYDHVQLTVEPEESRFEYIEFVPQYSSIVDVDECGVIHAKRGGTTNVTVIGNLISDNDEVKSIKTTFKVVIPKDNNTIKATPRKVVLKKAKLARKSVRIARKKAIKISNAKGKVTYALKSVSKKKFKKYFKINKKTGKILVKKGLKKGKYKLSIKVRAAGDISYKAAVKTVKVTVKVK